jgi:4-hydroxy-3-polyprenylbenzoate decarboxylase
MDRLSLAGSGAERFRPKTVRAAACQQVVRLGSDVDLESLPLVRCGAAEPAASMTGGIVVSEASDGAFMRLSRIDALLAGANRLLLAIGLQHELRADIEAARNRGEPFSLAIVLGGHPARMLAAEMPLGAGVDGLIMAGHLENRPLSIVPCRTHALPVPADAEWIVEGVIGPDAPLEDAGPLVGCCGHYYTCPDAPVMHVTALTHRANPLLPAMVPGLPPTEHDAVRAFLGRILLPAVRAAIPAVVDYHWPTGAAGAQTLFVSMRKRYARHARQIAAALWGHPLFATTKLTVLVDDSVDVRDTLAVLRAVGSGTLPGRDTFFHVGPADVAEPAAEEPGLGHAMAIDATAKPRREHPRPWPQAVLPDKDVAARVESRWKQLGLDGGS